MLLVSIQRLDFMFVFLRLFLWEHPPVAPQEPFRLYRECFRKNEKGPKCKNTNMIQNQAKWNRVHGIKLELLICWILQFLKNPWRSAVQLVNLTFDKKNKLANPFFLLCFSRMHFTKFEEKSNFILESTTWQEENKIGMISKLSCNFFVLTQNIEPFKYHIRRSSLLIIIIILM